MTPCRHLCFVVCLCFTPSLVNADAYRCTANGRTVYSAKPCAAEDAGRIAAGMTVKQVEQAWGKPAETYLDNDFQVQTERWTYIHDGAVTNVFIRNDAVAWIDGPHPVLVANDANIGVWVAALCLLVLLGGLVFFNVAVSAGVLRNSSYGWVAKPLQLAFVWLVPVFGALVVSSFLRKPEPLGVGERIAWSVLRFFENHGAGIDHGWSGADPGSGPDPGSGHDQW